MGCGAGRVAQGEGLRAVSLHAGCLALTVLDVCVMKLAVSSIRGTPSPA